VKKCQYCAEEIQDEAVKCKHCGSDLRTQSQPKLGSFIPNDRGADVSFLGASTADVADLFETFFHSNGFTLESGTKIAGTYGLGSSAGRLFSGGLAKRQKYDLDIAEVGDRVEASVGSAMSGWSGSALGAVREQFSRKEFKERLQAYFSQFR
jgi:hypothetical protein